MGSEAEQEPVWDDAPPRRVAGPAVRGAAMVLLVLVGACLGGATLQWIAQVFTPEPEEPEEVVEVLPTPDVVVAVRDLARLESASFHVERVIDMTSRQARLGGLVEAEDTILLVAAADVVAGVDLTELEDGDFVLEPDRSRVTITLPPARIFSARLDNDRTYVHHRSTDLLARRQEQLETRARREAERTLRQAALDAGIEERARTNARRTIESLARSLGYREVVVRFEEADPADPTASPDLD